MPAVIESNIFPTVGKSAVAIGRLRETLYFPVASDPVTDVVRESDQALNRSHHFVVLRLTVQKMSHPGTSIVGACWETTHWQTGSRRNMIEGPHTNSLKLHWVPSSTPSKLLQPPFACCSASFKLLQAYLKPPPISTKKRDGFSEEAGGGSSLERKLHLLSHNKSFQTGKHIVHKLSMWDETLP